jgi:MFS transporter, DHA1 family, multidrug resistance protein
MTSESAERPALTNDALNLPEVAAKREYGQVANLTVATAVGVTSMSFNAWWPFLPLYLIDLGAKSDADALFWMAIATTTQGVARLASGPVWGVLSDRYGRKMMLVRALFLSSVIGAVAAFVTEPWQIAIPLGLAGLVSGFNPAAVALVSVSVPDSRLTSSLSMVTGAQYVGNTLGPAFGALLAVVFDFKTTILVVSLIPMVTGAAVLFFVPRDTVGSISAGQREEAALALEPFKVTGQFALAVVLYFTIFAFNQVIRLATPIAFRSIEGSGKDVAGLVGLAFTLGGLVSAISVLFIAPRFFRMGRLRNAIVGACVIAGLGHLVAAAANVTPVYLLGFLMVATVLSAITPTTGTLIAANVTRSRRGTAFGIASSAQALSFAVGPGAAAVFAAVSLKLGFVVLAGLLFALALLLRFALREPEIGESVSEPV